MMHYENVHAIYILINHMQWIVLNNDMFISFFDKQESEFLDYLDAQEVQELCIISVIYCSTNPGIHHVKTTT